MMTAQQPEPRKQTQRIQVEYEPDASGTRVRIRLESHDESLGWYTSGSLSLAMCQLPLLRQALETAGVAAAPVEDPQDKIIPFPGSGRAAPGNAAG